MSFPQKKNLLNGDYRRISMFKRGFAILFFLLCFPLVSAGFVLNLTTGTASAGQPFDGYLEFNFTEAFATSAFVNVSTGNGSVAVPLNTLFAHVSGVRLIPSRFEKSSPKSAVLYQFSQPGAVLSSAIDLSEGGANSYDAVQDVRGVRFTLKGSQQGSDYPANVVLSLGNQVLYSFKGDFLQPAQYTPVNTSYVNGTPTGSKNIRGGKSDVFCERVVLPPTSEYRIRAVFSSVDDASQGINVSLGDAPSLDCDQYSCCQLHPTATQLSPSCILKKEIQQPQEAYVCLGVEGGDTDKTYAHLATDSDARSVAGYYNGQPVNLDYHLFADWRVFETRLMGMKQVNVSGDVLTTYKNQPGCGSSCLLLPLNISSTSAGQVEISNLSLEFSTNTGVSTLSSFTPLTYLSDQYNLTQVIRVSLSQISGLVAPSALNQYYDLRAQFLNYFSNRVTYQVVPGPVARLQYTTLNPSLGKQVQFDASRSYSPDNTTLVLFSWDFGDTATAEGMTTNHSYKSGGNYTVTLRVQDAKGLVGQKTVLVVPVSSLLSFGDQLTDAQNLTKTAEKKFSALGTIATDLALSSALQTATINLTFIQTSYAKLQANTTMNSTEKDLAIAALQEQFDRVFTQLPIDVIVQQSLQFPANILSVSQVPASLNKGNFDQFAEKVFKAQESVTIQGTATLVSVQYADGHSTSFFLIKKVIQGAGHYYEAFPTGVQVQRYLSEQPSLEQDAVGFTGATFTYLLDASSTTLAQAQQIKTIVIPGVLPDLETQSSNETPVATCGNNACETGEESTCPQDCQAQPPWIALSLLVVFLILGLCYIFLYKGKYSLGALFMKKKPAKELFTKEKDYGVVKQYVAQALEKGALPSQITEALQKKGWKQEQVAAVLEEVQKQKTMNVKQISVTEKKEEPKKV